MLRATQVLRHDNDYPVTSVSLTMAEQQTGALPWALESPRWESYVHLTTPSGGGGGGGAGKVG